MIEAILEMLKRNEFYIDAAIEHQDFDWLDRLEAQRRELEMKLTKLRDGVKS